MRLKIIINNCNNYFGCKTSLVICIFYYPLFRYIFRLFLRMWLRLGKPLILFFISFLTSFATSFLFWEDVGGVRPLQFEVVRRALLPFLPQGLLGFSIFFYSNSYLTIGNSSSRVKPYKTPSFSVMQNLRIVVSRI